MLSSSQRLTFVTLLKWSRKLVQLVEPLYGRTSWGVLTTTTGGYEDDADDDETLVPTVNDDATDESVIVGILLTDVATTLTDGTTEVVPVDGHAVTNAASAIATGGGETNAAASTNGVDTDEFNNTGI